MLRLHRRVHRPASLTFLAELRRAFQFPVKRLQRDHEEEVALAYVLGRARYSPRSD